MSDENNMSEKKCYKKSVGCCQGFGGGAYGLGFIGALIYFIQNADSFWVGVVGVFKAILWPAFLVYKLLGLLGM